MNVFEERIYDGFDRFQMFQGKSPRSFKFQMLHLDYKRFIFIHSPE